MAEEKDEKAQAGPAYPVERLIAEAPGLLGCSPHVAAGAFHGARKQSFTRDEAKKMVSAFTNRKVGG